jgi:hypothetical protein
MMALPNEFFASLDVIKKFSVINHEDAVIFVRHRLLPLGQIDNTQPP